jgi:hypothetical protein
MTLPDARRLACQVMATRPGHMLLSHLDQIIASVA